jgi:protein involved in polysaccharide export with SLBB domain
MQRLSIFVHVIVCFELCAAAQSPAQAPDPGFRVPTAIRPAQRKWVDPNFGAEALTNMDSLDNSQLLRIGDLISIRVLEDNRAAIPSRISPSGEVYSPYLGPIKSAGLTSKELAFQLKAKLEEQKFFPAAHVMVALDKLAADVPTGTDCTVEFVVAFGAVAKTGKYDYPPFEDLTVSDLIARAGGLTSDEKNPKIYIDRRTPQGRKRILVNTQAALSKKHGEYDLILRIDDVLIVTREVH